MMLRICYSGLILFFLVAAANCSPVRFREYKDDKSFEYRISTTVYRNDILTSSSEAVSRHKVVTVLDFPSEEVQWISKTSVIDRDTLNLDSIAKTVNPYRVSLSPKGSVLLPKFSVPELVGEITDLNTFYVAISPALDAQKLNKTTRSRTLEQLRHGNFADGIQILKGEDCLLVTQKLISVSGQFVTLETSFNPPPQFCLDPLIDSVKSNTADGYSNVQFVRQGQGKNVNLFWGVESFIIKTKIKRSNGQIVEASMNNELRLHMRYNSTPDLRSYQAEIPVTIKRYVELALCK